MLDLSATLRDSLKQIVIIGRCLVASFLTLCDSSLQHCLLIPTFIHCGANSSAKHWCDEVRLQIPRGCQVALQTVRAAGSGQEMIICRVDSHKQRLLLLAYACIYCAVYVLGLKHCQVMYMQDHEDRLV